MMHRRKTSLPKAPKLGPKFGLAVTTALASVMLTGCTTASAPPAQTSFAKAQSALVKGQTDRAIAYAEEAVLAEPRNPAYRAMLGAAYLEAGRFESAATSFDDALALGDQDPRTVLSYALARIALGDNQGALAKLTAWESAIDPSDLGLAYGLAGKPERGVHILTNTLRAGKNNAKVRQNLAYTYALAGNWRAARVMMAEDVPASEVDARLTEWAANAAQENFQVRVASLLKVTPSHDAGQPRHLALGNFPSQQMMVAQAEAQAPAEVALAEAPASISPPEVEPVAAPSLALSKAPPVAQPIRIGPNGVVKEKAVETAAANPAVKPAPRFVPRPVVQSVPERAAPPAPKRAASKHASSKAAQSRLAIATGRAATHLVQLGSFDSRAVAEEKWSDLKRKFPQLRDRDVVISKAVVDGRTFYRVAATGFAKSSASSMCSVVKSAGSGCFAYAASSPPAGVVDRKVRVASR